MSEQANEYSGLLSGERRQLIENELHRTGKLVTSELVTRFGVSDVTIRSDLLWLEKKGLLTRTHGGALPLDPASTTVAFDVRGGIRKHAKRRIALAAAKFVHDDQSIILDGGTTVHQLAEVLHPVNNLTVYTPGLASAQQLFNVDGIDVHLLGGQLDPTCMQTVGTVREQGIKDLLVDTAFLGTFGIDDHLDLIDRSHLIARGKLQYVRRARITIVLADSSKLHRSGRAKVMPLNRADVVITDSDISDEDRRDLEKGDFELIVT